jgi:hypothetical protein
MPVGVVLLALFPAAAGATYTGLQVDVTVGTPAAAGGWFAVPELYERSDSGSITGEPSYEATSSLAVARVSGPRRISFGGAEASRSTTMGPMLVVGARNVLAVAWTDTLGAGKVESAPLNASGGLPEPFTLAGAAHGLKLWGGPDGAYALSWSDASGSHAFAAPAGALQPAPLLGPGVPLAPGQRVVLSGGSSFWLASFAAGALTVAPAVFGQDSAPQGVVVGEAAEATTLGDGAGGVWALARGGRGWLAAHVSRAGQLSSLPLPASAARPELALAGSTAVIAYDAGPGCATYIERLRATSAAKPAAERTRLPARGCSTPQGLAVDPASATAFVLLHSRRGTTLLTEASNRHTSSWSGSLREHIDAIVAAGGDHVVVESNASQRNVGERCGGAGPSYAQAYLLRVFSGTRVVRTGRLEDSIENC